MIKAVFFDLYQTLVRYQPSQEELEAKALKNFGINVTAASLHLPILTANEYIYQQIAKRPLSQRSREETMALYMEYQRIVLKEARVFGVFGRAVWQTWWQVKALLDTGKFDPLPVITHRFPLSEFEQAFELAASGKAGKILLYP